MDDKKTSESGQLFILLILALVSLLGFTALAIDGGMIYADRRRAQNASDASSLAGAGGAAQYMENYDVNYLDWNCSGSNENAAKNVARNYAIYQADANDFEIDTDISDANGVSIFCQQGFHNGSYVEKYIDITTMITTATDTAIIQFVFDGPVINKVESIARVRPRAPLALGYAVVAIRDDCPNSTTGGVHIDGDDSISIDGGGIMSNACMRLLGSPIVTVTGGTITYMTDYDEANPATVSPPPVQGTVPIPDYWTTVEEPDCSGLANRASPNPNNDVVISPGRYHRIRHNNNGPAGTGLELEPGLYCLSGNFAVTGGTVSADGVTIFFTAGNFSSSGNAKQNLTAPPVSSCSVCPPAIPGILIFLAYGHSGNVTLTGTADSGYVGTVFAPNGTVEVGGTGSQLETVHTQLVAETVFLHGTTSIDINFIGEDNFSIPAMLELNK